MNQKATETKCSTTKFTYSQSTYYALRSHLRRVIFNRTHKYTHQFDFDLSIFYRQRNSMLCESYSMQMLYVHIEIVLKLISIGLFDM